MPKKTATRARGGAKKSPARKTQKRSATPPRTARAPKLSQTRELADAIRREHEKTLKVLRALPADQADLRPHPRLKTARELAWVFVIEQGMMKRALRGEPIFGSSPSPGAPQQLAEIIRQIDAGRAELESLVNGLDDADLEENTQFPIGPNPAGGLLMGDWTRRAFAWFMLSDHIHHRGQMSIYLRIAGGKVPSIYGPSGDETWR